MKLLQLRIIALLFWLPLATGLRAQSTEVQYLSGTGNDHTVNWQFYCTDGQNSGKWTTIAVPSCWELQGFGKYDYGFAKDSIRGKEKGMYRKAFAVPASWKGKAINIVFEGVMTDAEVKVNGQLAGPVHQGAFYSFKYDISSLLKYDANNLLEVTVAKHSANASVNAAERHADFWLFGGIFRPVFLEAMPQQHIENVAIDAKANGHVTADVFVKGNVDRVSMQLYATTGLMYGRICEAVVDKANGKSTISCDYPDPLLWNAETPNLFRAVFTTYSNGRPGHSISQRFGFRTIEVKERDGVYINGVKIRFKGVDRHSFWPTSGRTTSYGISLRDVQLMKDMNMNAVRMSHYPPDAHFLEVCDSLGLYVMDELTGWHGHYNTETGTKLVHEMLVHDVNHPSIIFWNNGNEGGHNLDLDHLFDEGDIQHRPVIHPWMIFRGFDTQHYREYNYGIGNYDHGHNIIMPTEFLHGLFDGGHGAGLEDYWNEMLQNPLSAGGFLWSFADEGVVRTDKDGIIDVDGNHGPDGIVGPYHEKEGSYFAIKEIWSPVAFERKEFTPAFDGKFVIENRYEFTNTSQCHFTWKLAKFGHKEAGVTAVQKGNIVSPSIAPGQKGTIQLNLPPQWQQYDVLYVTVTDPYQRELFTWSFKIASPAVIAATLLPANNGGKATVTERDSIYAITANGVNIEINRNSGLLQKVQSKGKEIPFNDGPVIQEAVNNFQNFSYHYEDNNLVIASTFDRKKSYNTLQWTIYPSGIVKMKVNYFPSEHFVTLLGVNFSFPEGEIKSVQYMGDGPYRVWKNRMKGTMFGVWNKDYNNTATGEDWVYPEFKGYYSNLYWCTFNTTGQPFTVWTEDEDVFLRLFTPAKQDDQYGNEQPVFPSGDISFMQGIPGIGNKTQKPETTGPMGMKYIYYDFEKDLVRAKELVMYFDFSGK